MVQQSRQAGDDSRDPRREKGPDERHLDLLREPLKAGNGRELGGNAVSGILTAEEIDFWDKSIERSGDLDLARKFYPKTGRPNRAKEVFLSATRDLADHAILLQQNFEQGVYRPELTDDEVRQIAAEAVRHDVKNEYLGEIFTKLSYPVYALAKFSDEEMGDLVNKALREGAQGLCPGANPREFADRLIEFPYMHECPEEVSFTYAVFDDERYQRFAKPQLATNIVTLKVFHEFLLGGFEEALQIRDKYSQHYDRTLAIQLVQDFIEHEYFSEENYPLEYLVAAQRSSFRDLFPDDLEGKIEQRAKEFDDYVEQKGDRIPKGVDIQQSREKHLAGYRRLALARDIADFLDENREVKPTKEMDHAVTSFTNEFTKQEYAERRGLSHEKTIVELEADLLDRAFDSAEEIFGIFAGMTQLNALLSDNQYIERVGRENVGEILTQRTTKAMQNGKAHVVYALMFGTNLGRGYRRPAVAHFDEYVTVNKSDLLEAMVSSIEWEPEYLLSNKYDFSSDNLTFAGASEVDDAYELYKSIKKEGGRLPSDLDMKKLLFLKMAVHAKEHYGYNGMNDVAGVFEDPNNAAYVDQDQTRRLLTKVFTDYFEKGLDDGILGAKVVSYFYALASSELGTLFREDQRLTPYFKLHEFIEAK